MYTEEELMYQCCFNEEFASRVYLGLIESYPGLSLDYDEFQYICEQIYFGEGLFTAFKKIGKNKEEKAAIDAEAAKKKKEKQINKENNKKAKEQKKANKPKKVGFFKGIKNNVNTSVDNITKTTDDIKTTGGNVRKTSENIKNASRDVKSTTGNIKDASENVKNATGNIKYASRDVRNATGNINGASENVKKASDDVSYITGDIRQKYDNMKSGTKKVINKRNTAIAGGAAVVGTGLLIAKNAKDKKNYRQWIAQNPDKDHISFKQWKDLGKPTGASGRKPRVKASAEIYDEAFEQGYLDGLEFINENLYLEDYELY